MYFVYILECENGSLYTGITTDVARRFKEHASGVGGRYTKSQKVLRVVYSERHPNRSSASKREAEIKSWRRDRKLALFKIVPPPSQAASSAYTYNMIGLKRGTVKLLPYHKNWAQEFEKERQRLENALGEQVVDIQHIGSTSVPGLVAKPIIDISIGVRKLSDVPKLKKIFSRLGYGFYKKFSRQALFAKGPEERRTHYVHVMRYKGAKWTTDILFRNFLRAHPQRANQYALLKKKLARKYPLDREKYTDGKNIFIKTTLRMARRR